MQELRWDNAFVRELPADPVRGPQVRQVLAALYSHVSPTPVTEPRRDALPPGQRRARMNGESSPRPS